MKLQGDFIVLNKLSRLCLGLQDSRVDDGAAIQQQVVSGALNQLWQFVPIENGYYEIVAKQSGGCIDDGYSSTVDGGLIHHWSRHSGENQRWKLQELPDGYYLIISKIGGLCIDGKLEVQEGAGIHLWKIHQGATQLWKFVPVTDIPHLIYEQKRRKDFELPTPVKQLASVDLPIDITSGVDLRSIASRMAQLFDDLKGISYFKNARERAGIFKKSWWAATGKTSDSLISAVEVQAELVKIQSMLMVLNTIIAKALNKQQEFMIEQQEEIQHSNELIVQDGRELQAQNNELEEKADQVLALVKLTPEREQRIHDVIRQAQSVNELDTKLGEAILSEARERKNAVDEQLRMINELRNGTQASLDQIRTTFLRRFRWVIYLLTAIAGVLIWFAFKVF